MKNTSIKLILGLLAGLICLAPVAVSAADAPPPLAEEYMVTPKNDQMGEFQAALKAHTELRKEKGDPRKWQIYTSIVGNELNVYTIRQCCFNWADLDSYAEWDAANPEVLGDWFENVEPHVGKIQHFFSEYDWSNSHWTGGGDPYQFYAVTEWKVKPGQEADFSIAKKTMSQIALNQGWANTDRNWMWTTQIGGHPVNSMVVPHKNFADMAGGDVTFAEFLTKHLGSGEAASELLKKFSASTWGSEMTIWQHLPGLSMDMGE